MNLFVKYWIHWSKLNENEVSLYSNVRRKVHNILQTWWLAKTGATVHAASTQAAHTGRS